MKQLGYSPLQTFRVSRPGDAYLHRATEAFGMRRGGRQGHFLAGVICATTGLGLCGEGLAMAVAPRHPVVGQVLFFVAIVVPFTIFLTVLMIPRLGSLREITVAILGLYPATGLPHVQSTRAGRVRRASACAVAHESIAWKWPILTQSDFAGEPILSRA